MEYYMKKKLIWLFVIFGRLLVLPYLLYKKFTLKQIFTVETLISKNKEEVSISSSFNANSIKEKSNESLQKIIKKNLEKLFNDIELVISKASSEGKFQIVLHTEITLTDEMVNFLTNYYYNDLGFKINISRNRTYLGGNTISLDWS